MPNLPLPKGIAKMPKEYVYLGLGRTFQKTGDFDGLISNGEKKRAWYKPWHGGKASGSSTNLHYCAHRDSEVAKLNRTNK